jgi:hypothetical protein
LCFQIIQAPRIIREFTPFLYSLFTFLITLCHQSAKLHSLCQGTQSPRFKGARRLNQTYRATTQEVVMNTSPSNKGTLISSNHGV